MKTFNKKGRLDTGQWDTHLGFLSFLTSMQMSEALISKDRSQTWLENKNIPSSKKEGHPETRKQMEQQ